MQVFQNGEEITVGVVTLQHHLALVDARLQLGHRARGQRPAVTDGVFLEGHEVGRALEVIRARPGGAAGGEQHQWAKILEHA